MTKIKLIALDLDDTLLRTDLTISRRAKNAIWKAVEQGTAVTLATGRMFSSALPYALELGLNLPLITYQGALVKYADGRVISQSPIPLATARSLAGFLLPLGYHLNVYINDELYMEKDTPEARKYAASNKVPIHFVEDLQGAIKAEPLKMLVIAEEPRIDTLAEKLRREFNGLGFVKSRADYLEINDLGATKGQALEKLAQSLGLVKDQVMAVGDSMNDFDMIKYAGWGIAMHNAVPEVKAAAQYVTRNNDDDGVAEAIEKYVLY